MKKIELHLHLDGSINIEYANKLIGADVKDKLIGTNSTSLKNYLEKFDLPGELLQSYDNIEEFSYLLGKDLEADDVIYAEVRFCPLFHIKEISVDRVILAILMGFKRVPNVKINLIFCMMRHFTYEENLEIIKLKSLSLYKEYSKIINSNFLVSFFNKFNFSTILISFIALPPIYCYIL